MKINKKTEVIIVTLLYLACLFIWTQPFQNNPIPYGEVDAGSHFSLADYIALSDKTITTLPYYIDFRYGHDNEFKPHVLWYPPSFHIDLAIAAISANARAVPIYLLNAIFCSAIVLILYFVIRNLFGFWPAFLSALLVMFSGRDYMVYLWGQWPERIAQFFVPLVLYCFYKYSVSYFDKKEKVQYLYIMFALLGVNLLLHPMGAIHSIMALVVVALFFWIKERKFPFNIKHLSIGILIFIVIIAVFPLQTGNAVKQMLFGRHDETVYAPTSRLFQWSFDPDKYAGAVPPAYFSFKEMHGLWTLPFLIIGIIFLALRRKREDLLLLGWLVSLYIMIHLDVIGKGPFVHRSLAASAHIFVPLTAIGLLAIPSLIKVGKKYQSYLKYGLIALFIILAITINAKSAYTTLRDSYAGIARLTPYQYEAAEWMRANLPLESDVENIGTLNLAKQRWMQYVSQRHINKINSEYDENLTSTHIMLDYSDAMILQQYYPEYKQQIEEMQAYEANLTNSNATLLYDKNYIRVYKLG